MSSITREPCSWRKLNFGAKMLPLLCLPLLLLLLLLPWLVLLPSPSSASSFSCHILITPLVHCAISIVLRIETSAGRIKHINRRKIVQTHNLIVQWALFEIYYSFTAPKFVYLFTNSTGARNTVPVVIVRMLCVAGSFLSIRVSQSHWMFALCNMHGI